MSLGEPRISEELDAKFNAVLDRAMASLGHVFFKRPNNRPVPHATGVFISVGGEPGLVMADHSVDGDGKGPGILMIGGPGASDLVPLRGTLLRSTDSDPENAHRVDVAVCRLTPETVAGISIFEPFTIDAVETPATYSRERRFAVVGFPSSKTKTMPPSDPMRSGMMLYAVRERAPSEPVADVPWLRPDIHLVLNYETEGMAYSAGLNSAPALSGVSGGGVFDLGPTLDLQLPPKLVGFLTHHLQRQKVLIATRLHPVVYGIRE